MYIIIYYPLINSFNIDKKSVSKIIYLIKGGHMISVLILRIFIEDSMIFDKKVKL
jgi:hypothetical protein